MKLFIKQVLLLIIAILHSIVVVSQMDKGKRIDSLMRAAHEIGVFNGNILVVRNKKVIYKAEIGYADSGRTKLLGPEHRFAIGSITKEFNSVGIMILKEKGKLYLDDKISIYLPELPEWADKIQIKHLLQYTSGLPKSLAGSDSSVLNSLMKLEKLEFEPGSAFNYSSVDVFIRMRIIERITGLSYNDFIKSYLFKPSDMSGVIIDTSAKNINIAQSFDNNFNETTNTNSLYLTIKDLYQWTEALHSYKIINKTSLMELAESFGGTEGSLGEARFEKDELKLHIHMGSGNYYEALLFRNNEFGITILLMTNNQNFKVHQLKDAIVNILLDNPYILPKKSIYGDIRNKVFDDFEKGIAFYNQIKLTQQDKYDFTSEVFDLYSTGIYLMNKNHFDDAIKLFHLGTILDLNNYSGISYAFTWIGRCYLKSGNNGMAFIYYKKAFDLDEKNKTAEGMFKEISRDIHKF